MATPTRLTPNTVAALSERSRGERAQRVERVPPCSLIPIPSLSESA